ncbi:MAG: hypothetical protein QG630_370 [Patescibacteria group bacterium]|nr:hypothetical protein [Patescibacteria group bacterium]
MSIFASGIVVVASFGIKEYVILVNGILITTFSFILFFKVNITIIIIIVKLKMSTESTICFLFIHSSYTYLVTMQGGRGFYS